MTSDRTGAPPLLRCPECGGPVALQGNSHRPFCSLICRLIDLGVWLDERYRIPGPELPREAAGNDALTPPAE